MPKSARKTIVVKDGPGPLDYKVNAEYAEKVAKAPVYSIAKKYKIKNPNENNPAPNQYSSINKI